MEENITLLDKLEPTAIKIDRIMIDKIGLKEAILFQVLNDYFDQGNEYVTITKLIVLFPYLGKKAINAKLDKLIKLGYMECVELKPEEKKQLLINKNMQGFGIGEDGCEWCGCKTLVLHEHHYPVSRKLFGVKVVNICGTCHYEYHHLDTLKVVKRVI